MNNSIFGNNDHEDPWDNGWANSEPTGSMINSSSGREAGSNSGGFGIASSYLSPSQLLGTHTPSPPVGGSAHDTPSSSATPIIDNVPLSYKEIYTRVGELCSTTNELESLVFNRIISRDQDGLTPYQKLKIVDIMYDHNLLPPSRPVNFYQILGLVALELELPGSGDFVTLQFRISDLPKLPPSVVKAIINDESTDNNNSSNQVRSYSPDPLNAQLANTSISEDDQDQQHQHNQLPSSIIDPILTDHSSIQQRQHQEGGGISGPNDPILFNEITKYITEIKDTFEPVVGSKDLVRIKEVPEKEGLLFKHTNYIISHEIKLGLMSPAGSKKVIRRYSDFVWLLEYLLKKYPFRIIPGLPPKKFTGSAPDSQFLQKRRRGLNRFLNQLVKHPVLVLDSVVVTFLSVPTDLATWKKQAKVDYSLEFKGMKILTHFINSIWPTIGDEFLKDWKQSELNINKLIEVWTKCVLLVERYEKRQQQISLDNGKFVEMINKFSSLNEAVYPHDTNSENNEDSKIVSTSNKDDMSAINDSLGSILNFFNKSSQLLIDESFLINTTILEKFKNYLDYLYSLQELFERSKKLLINNIPQLQNRIQENEKRYQKLSTDDVDIKGSELAKLRQVIINDKQEIFQQLNKDWLIKECCFKEFIMFQKTQYLISELWIDWSKGRLKFQEKYFGLSEVLSKDVVGDMPTK